MRTLGTASGRKLGSAVMADAQEIELVALQVRLTEGMAPREGRARRGASLRDAGAAGRRSLRGGADHRPCYARKALIPEAGEFMIGDYRGGNGRMINGP